MTDAKKMLFDIKVEFKVCVDTQIKFGPRVKICTHTVQSLLFWFVNVIPNLWRLFTLKKQSSRPDNTVLGPFSERTVMQVRAVVLLLKLSQQLFCLL